MDEFMSLPLFASTSKTQPIEKDKISVYCWNIGNPSKKRAQTQAEWLFTIKPEILVLTETKASQGCDLIKYMLKVYGYNMFFSRPPEKEFGTMIASKFPLKKSLEINEELYLPSRVASVVIDLPDIKEKCHLIGVYVPSRDSSQEKIDRKLKFLRSLYVFLRRQPQHQYGIFCGDLNILESNHVPHYPFFREWEYGFYDSLTELGFIDAFRYYYPDEHEYSWIGRSGDGYRYDHCFVTSSMINQVSKIYYDHEPRENHLSDHSAIVLEISKLDLSNKG